jgi:choline dehydrogenase-like flavoprotein
VPTDATQQPTVPPLTTAGILDPDTQLHAEVAIVGAGPAGIVLALELADAGHKVALIESGGERQDPVTQRLGDALGDDPAHTPMHEATRRQIGGASNIWGGRCVPFDPIDLQPRELTADAAWPLAYDELARYYARACRWCVCGEGPFHADEIPDLAGRSLIPGWPEGEVRASTLERWSLPTNFRREYLARLKASPNVALLSERTCTEVACTPQGDGIGHLVTQTLHGDCATVRARRYVLAAGGLESTRLLLASRSARHPAGIGNHSDHLGRWYMAHIEARIARAHFTPPPRQTLYAYERDPQGAYVRRRFTLAPELQRQHALPNAALWLENPEISDPAHRSGALSLVYLMLVSPLGRYIVSEGIRKHQLGDVPRKSAAHLANVLRSPAATTAFAGKLAYGRYLQPGRRVPGFFVRNRDNVYALLYQSEHLPNRDSRVLLAAQRDALGVPRLRTQMRIAQRDIDAVARTHRLLDDYLRRHALGRLEYIVEDFDKAIRDRFFYGCHQSGTTRMAARPEDGVLDANLAVHGVSDLFVASSSAFPTSSQANSTFTIVAFALRLADHLHRSLRARRSLT